MTDPLHIAAGETETLRVFALDLPKTEAEALAKATLPNGAPSPLADMLGVAALDRARVELFPASDLKGIGLAGYISEGLGVAPADVEANRAALDAETGYVLILHAGATGESAVTLAPKPELRHLGTYRLAQAAPPRLTHPAPPGDMPATATASADPQTAVPARLPRSLVLLGLLAAAVIVLAIAYMIGASER